MDLRRSMSPMKLYANFRVYEHFSGERLLSFRQIFKGVSNPQRVKNHRYMELCAKGWTWMSRLQVENPGWRMRVWMRPRRQWKVLKILSGEPHNQRVFWQITNICKVRQGFVNT